MIKRASLIGLVSTGVLTGMLFLFGTTQQAFSCLFGGGLMTANLAGIIWTFKKIFQKKSIALAAAVIVFKYATLIGLFVFLNFLGWRVDMGFLIGISVLLPTLGILALQHVNMGEENGSF